MFALHPRLEADCFPVTELKLCSVLLMNNLIFPWLILVPRVENACELFDLSENDRQQLMQEVSLTAETLKRLTGAHKMNIAALGNQVPQLHVHIIARNPQDAAWPNPVWSADIPSEPYAYTQGEALAARYADALKIPA